MTEEFPDYWLDLTHYIGETRYVEGKLVEVALARDLEDISVEPIAAVVALIKAGGNVLTIWHHNENAPRGATLPVEVVMLEDGAESIEVRLADTSGALCIRDLPTIPG